MTASFIQVFFPLVFATQSLVQLCGRGEQNYKTFLHNNFCCFKIGKFGPNNQDQKTNLIIVL